MQHAGDTEESIDLLLERFALELRYFVETRDALAPVIFELWESLCAYLRDPSGEGARLPRLRELRTAYFRILREMNPLIEEWLGIRGSGERLWDAEPFMDDRQWGEFTRLQVEESRVTAGREQFDYVHADLRPKLLVFSELQP